MYIHHGARLIYLAHPRTASHATCEALKGVGFARLAPPSNHHTQLWEPNSPIPVTRENREEWTVFTTVRNHWDAALSWIYRKASVRPADGTPAPVASFDQAMGAPNIWVKDHEMWWLHSNDADIILRYETLQEDLNFLGDFGVDIPQLDQVNVTTKRPMREYRPLYTEETRRWVAEKFRDEIERFNYRF